MGRVAARLRQQLTLTDAVKAAALDCVGSALARQLIATAPGKLGQTIQWQPDSPTAGRITMGAVARYVIAGHGAYTIEPRNKQALYWRGARHPVKRVHMKPKAPNDFVSRAWHSANVTAARGVATHMLLSGLYEVAKKV